MEILASIKLKKEEADVSSICNMIEMALKWRTKTLGRGHALTLRSQYDLAMAKRECNLLQDARDGFRSVFLRRRALLGELHSDTLCAKREFIVTCSALGYWGDPESPALAKGISNLSIESSNSTLDTPTTTTPPSSEPRGDRLEAENPDLPWSVDTHDIPPSSIPISPEKHEQTHEEQPFSEEPQPPMLSLDDWALVESHSKSIAAEQESRIGVTHPETINTLLWIFAVHLLVEKMAEGAQTMTTLLSRLRRPTVRSQRLLNALETEEKVAWICMEQDMVDFALEVWAMVGARMESLLKAKDAKKEHVELALKFIGSAPRRWMGDWLGMLRADVERVVSAEEEEPRKKEDMRLFDREKGEIESMGKMGEMHETTTPKKPVVLRLHEKVKAALTLCLETWRDGGESLEAWRDRREPDNASDTCK